MGLLSLGNLFFARKASGASTTLDLLPLVASLSVPLIFVSMEVSQASFRNQLLADQAAYYLLLILYDLFLIVASSLAYRSLLEE